MQRTKEEEDDIKRKLFLDVDRDLLNDVINRKDKKRVGFKSTTALPVRITANTKDINASIYAKSTEH